MGFYSSGDFLLAYVTIFSGQLYFRRSYFFTVLHCNYFEIPVTFSEQLFLQNSSFFGGASFFRLVTSTQQLLLENIFFFRTKLLPTSHFLRTSCYYRAVTFRNNYVFWWRSNNRIKILFRINV